jgi:putative flippase GtrA
MDVRPEGRVHPIIAQIVPTLAMKQRADLHDPHVVVGVGKTEEADLIPLLEDEPAATHQPGKDDKPLPVALGELNRLPFPLVDLALQHFSGCSRQTSNGKQPDMATRLNVSQETLQLVRFALVGFFLAGIYSAIYWYLATFVMPPMLAVVIAFVVAVSIGFVLHSRWSFRGHGKREDRRMKIKFLAVQSSGFFLNEGFTWILTGPMNGPTWWPLVPAIFVTPLATYMLNRQLVFG